MSGPTRGRVAVYMVALFLGGAITGAAVMSHFSAAPKEVLKVGRADEISRLIQDKLDTRLGLSPEQQQKFAPLIKRASEELEASHLDCLKRVSAAIDLLHMQLAPDLTADQKEKLKQLETERVTDWRAKYNYNLDPARTNAP